MFPRRLNKHSVCNVYDAQQSQKRFSRRDVRVDLYLTFRSKDKRMSPPDPSGSVLLPSSSRLSGVKSRDRTDLPSGRVCCSSGILFIMFSCASTFSVFPCDECNTPAVTPHCHRLVLITAERSHRHRSHLDLSGTTH